MSDTRTQALADVSAERDRQEARWGEQNHPTVAPHLRDDADGTVSSRVSRCYEVPMSSSARAALEYHVAHDTVTYGDILIEEVAEALEAAAEHGDDSDEARAEMVQVAAVAVAIVEAIDRRRARRAEEVK